MSIFVHPKISFLWLVQFKFSFLVCRWLELCETPRTVRVLLESLWSFTCLCHRCKVWRCQWIHKCLCVCTNVHFHVNTHVHPHTPTDCFMPLLPAEELSDCSAHFYYYCWSTCPCVLWYLIGIPSVLITPFPCVTVSSILRTVYLTSFVTTCPLFILLLNLNQIQFLKNFVHHLLPAHHVDILPSSILTLHGLYLFCSK